MIKSSIFVAQKEVLLASLKAIDFCNRGWNEVTPPDDTTEVLPASLKAIDLCNRGWNEVTPPDDTPGLV